MNRRSAQPNVFYAETAQYYLEELSVILYEKHYFSFKDSAYTYVRTLVQDMEATIHLKMRRRAPEYFSRYGKDLWFVSYPRSKQTTWYFFFSRYANNIYVIRYITNSHIAGHLV